MKGIRAGYLTGSVDSSLSVDGRLSVFMSGGSHSSGPRDRHYGVPYGGIFLDVVE